jgi:hypothetical protein
MNFDMMELGPVTYSEVISRNGTWANRSVPTGLGRASGALQEMIDELLPFSAIVLSHPELVLLEGLARRGYVGSVIVVADRVGILRRNVPKGVDANMLPPHSLSGACIDTDCAMVTIGLDAGARLTLIPTWSKATLDAVGQVWFGPSILLQPSSASTKHRSPDWCLVNEGAYFTERVRRTERNHVEELLPVERTS